MCKHQLAGCGGLGSVRSLTADTLLTCSVITAQTHLHYKLQDEPTIFMSPCS